MVERVLGSRFLAQWASDPLEALDKEERVLTLAFEQPKASLARLLIALICKGCSKCAS